LNLIRHARLYAGHVIAGLDPAIHHFLKRMDARIKSAHDDGYFHQKQKLPTADTPTDADRQPLRTAPNPAAA